MFTDIPITSRMTQKFIDKTSDKDLVFAILEYLSKEFQEDEDSQQVFSRFPNGYKIVSNVLNILGAQVDNGGFNQYFYNRYDETIDEQLEALTLLKANKHKSIVERAVQIRDEEKQNMELQKLYQEGSHKAFGDSYKITNLNGLDEE